MLFVFLPIYFLSVREGCSVVSDSLRTHGLPDSCVCGILQARILEWVAVPFSMGFPNPGIEPRSPTLQVDSLLSEPPGKPIYFLVSVVCFWFCGPWVIIGDGEDVTQAQASTLTCVLSVGRGITCQDRCPTSYPAASPTPPPPPSHSSFP